MAEPDSTELPFRDYRRYLIERHGRVLYRVPIDLGFGCPHRHAGGGCTFCGPDASRAAHLTPDMPLEEQVARGIQVAQKRYGAEGFIAYFQAGTATSAPLDLLRERVGTVLAAAPFPVVVVATRPDCLSEPVLDWLGRLRERHEVWVELGVQTCQDRTLLRLNRGHDSACSLAAARALQARGIYVAAHVILGLPGEQTADFVATACRLREGAFAGAKIHNLHIVRGSGLEAPWRRGEIETMDEHAYGEALMEFLRHLPAEWPLMRLAADTPPGELLAPHWWMTKGEFRQYVVTQMQRRGWRQGDRVGGPEGKVPAAAVAVDLSQTRQFRVTAPPEVRARTGSSLAALLQASRMGPAASARGAVVLAIGFGEGPLGMDGLDVLPECLGARVSLHGLSAAPGALARMRVRYPHLDGCLAALELGGHCRRAWGRVAVHWGDPRRTVVRLAGSADLVILEPDQSDTAPGLFSLDFLRRVVRLMASGAVLVSACSAPELRGALLRLGLTVGRAQGPGLPPQGGTVAARDPAGVLVPLSDRDRRIALESTSGIPYRDRTLNWSRTLILQHHERLVERMRRRGLASGAPEPPAAVGIPDPSQEDACA